MKKPITSRAKCSPAQMKSLLYKKDGPGDKKESKKKVDNKNKDTSNSEISIKESLKKQYPKSTIKQDPKKPNNFRVISERGNSFNVTRHKGKKKKTITPKEALAIEFKKKN